MRGATAVEKAHLDVLVGPMMVQLDEAVTKLQSWDQGVALVLSGENRAFCAGADFELAREALGRPKQGKLMSLLMSDTLERLRQARSSVHQAA